MSSVTVPLYHYALLKGYLAGHNPPSEVMVAVEALYMAAVQGPLRSDALDAIHAVKEAAERLAGLAKASPAVEISIAKPEATVVMSSSEEIVLPPLTKRALEMAAERADSSAATSQPQTDEAKIEAFLEARDAENCPPTHASGSDQEMVVGGMVEPKKRKEWSPEARATAAERMRARRAAGLMGGRKTGSAPEPASPPEPAFEIRKPSKSEPEPAPKPKLVPAIDPTRLITVHNGYAGKREDGQLRDEDWPDIKSRLTRGETKRDAVVDQLLDDLVVGGESPRGRVDAHVR